ncbi:hypothetical protein IWQ54_001162 [Labrenzia sp. EL_195]|nr:hypothetical protein [Labrenzia sp. EL_195]
MTTRTKKPIVCECGHKGFLKCAENDQPFSGLWEKYSLEGFSGRSLEITNYKDMPENILASLKPCCPSCGKANLVRFDKEQ